MERAFNDSLECIEKLRAMSRGYFHVISCREALVEKELILHSKKVRAQMSEFLKLCTLLDNTDANKKARTSDSYESMSAAMRRVSRDVAHSLAAETRWRYCARKRSHASLQTHYQDLTTEDLKGSLSTINKQIKPYMCYYRDNRIKRIRFLFQGTFLGKIWASFLFDRIHLRGEKLTNPFQRVMLTEVLIGKEPDSQGQEALMKKLAALAFNRFYCLSEQHPNIEAVLVTLVEWLHGYMIDSLKDNLRWITATEYVIQPEWYDIQRNWL